MARNGKRNGSKRDVISGAVTAIDHLRSVLLEVEDALARYERTGVGRHPLTMESPRQCAQRLHVDIEDVRAWVDKGLPHVKLGKKVRIMTFEADEWLRAHEGAQLRA